MFSNIFLDSMNLMYSGEFSVDTLLVSLNIGSAVNMQPESSVVASRHKSRVCALAEASNQ